MSRHSDSSVLANSPGLLYWVLQSRSAVGSTLLTVAAFSPLVTALNQLLVDCLCHPPLPPLLSQPLPPLTAGGAAGDDLSELTDLFDFKALCSMRSRISAEPLPPPPGGGPPPQFRNLVLSRLVYLASFSSCQFFRGFIQLRISRHGLGGAQERGKIGDAAPFKARQMWRGKRTQFHGATEQQ
jgi:hypothetical protein